MSSRDLIGQAKGILMERYDISSDQAFAVLTRVSQQRNRKLREVAQELTSTRKLIEQTRPSSVLGSDDIRRGPAGWVLNRQDISGIPVDMLSRRDWEEISGAGRR